MSLLAAVCLLTFLHYAGAQMRGPILPLYAAAHGATATGVGFIVAAHMAVAAAGSIPLGRLSDVWGRRPLLLGGMLVSAVTSLFLPLFEGELALMTIYGLAGFGVAAFTPSALSLVGDGAAPGRAGYAFAWYTTAHYGAIAVGPFLGGLAAQWWGYREAFVGSAIVVAAALVFGLALPAPAAPPGTSRQGATFADIRGNANVWAGWIVSVGGLTTQGVVFTFFPLLAHERGLSPVTIGLVFLVLGLANTLARFPAGWLVDRRLRSGQRHGRCCHRSGPGWLRPASQPRNCHGRLQHSPLSGARTRIIRARPRHHPSRVFCGLLRRGSGRGAGLVDRRSSLGEGRAT